MSSRISVTIPTELRNFLTKRPEAFNRFSKMPKRIKQQYALFVIESDSHKERLCRARKVTAWITDDARTARMCAC